MRYGIALDLGTSGFRCQAIDIDSKKTVATAVTERHPIPGMNVIDHVNFAMKAGEDVANGLMIGAINNLFKELNIDLPSVEVIAVCGNPFQLSLFQNIEIRVRILFEAAERHGDGRALSREAYDRDRKMQKRENSP